jgi:uncharacterized protein
MRHELVVPVGDLIGSPGKERPFKGGTSPARLDFGDSRVDGPMSVSGRVVGLIDAVEAEFDVTATGHFTCTRCLIEWDEPVMVEAKQYFRTMPDEDGYAIVDDEVDVSGPARDELALALPAKPLCRQDCLGLCPTCGTDLNSEPCGGHGDDSDSPFATLKDLLEP